MHFWHHARDDNLVKSDAKKCQHQRTKDKTKLSPRWLALYIVVEIARLGAYQLAEIDGDILPNTWNMDQLQRFYV